MASFCKCLCCRRMACIEGPCGSLAPTSSARRCREDGPYGTALGRAGGVTSGEPHPNDMGQVAFVAKVDSSITADGLLDTAYGSNGAANGLNTAPLGADTLQQTLLTTSQHA